MPSEPQQISPSQNPYLNAIQWGGWRWNDGNPPSGTNITYLFDPGGKDLGFEFQDPAFGMSVPWTTEERNAYELALDRFEHVANITFTEVTAYAQADLVEHVYTGGGDPELLGSHETPQDAFNIDGTAWGAYNREGWGWTPEGLQVGGYGFVTFVHEIGHALGLAHPHDNGGGSGLFPGVTLDDPADQGDNSLNQGIFTTMSYLSGWNGPFGRSSDDAFGWEAGPMAFDIAAIQYLYAANMSYRTGNDTYYLPDVNAAGTYWSCLWDAGGTDQIVYQGARDVTIDLRAATLENSPIGGGAPSYADGIHGGYTIANKVIIENAITGNGDDQVTGNAFANALIGGEGNDRLSGDGGLDTFGFEFDITTTALQFRNGTAPSGSANMRAWDNYFAQLEGWRSDLTKRYGPDLELGNTLTVHGTGKNAGKTFVADNSFTTAVAVDGDGYDYVTDFLTGGQDRLCFEDMSADEFQQLYGKGLVTVDIVPNESTLDEDTVIGWVNGSITLQHQALSAQQLLKDYIVFA